MGPVGVAVDIGGQQLTGVTFVGNEMDAMTGNHRREAGRSDVGLSRCLVGRMH